MKDNFNFFTKTYYYEEQEVLYTFKEDKKNENYIFKQVTTRMKIAYFVD